MQGRPSEFLSEVKARHDKMVGSRPRVMNDKR